MSPNPQNDIYGRTAAALLSIAFRRNATKTLSTRTVIATWGSPIAITIIGKTVWDVKYHYCLLSKYCTALSLRTARQPMPLLRLRHQRVTNAATRFGSSHTDARVIPRMPAHLGLADIPASPSHCERTARATIAVDFDIMRPMRSRDDFQILQRRCITRVIRTISREKAV